MFNKKSTKLVGINFLPNIVNGFSLIEVIVACAILAGVGAAILQSQINASQTLYKLKFRATAQEFIDNKLQEIERNPEAANTRIENEKFPIDHPLSPGVWSLIPSTTSILEIPMLKIECIVNYKELGLNRVLRGFVILDAGGAIVKDDEITKFIQEQINLTK